MTDIVERLRQPDTYLNHFENAFEAADEIERLRAMINHGDAAAFEEYVASIIAKNAPEIEKANAYIRKVEAERDAAVAVLRQYSQHLPMCRSNVLLTSMPPQRQPCDCGLDAAIDAARGEK